jgi:energy-coupling factor transport system substrate-specific component
MGLPGLIAEERKRGVHSPAHCHSPSKTLLLERYATTFQRRVRFRLSGFEAGFLPCRVIGQETSLTLRAATDSILYSQEAAFMPSDRINSVKTRSVKMSPVKTSLLFAFVALNLTVGGLVSWLKLPIYLDSIGIVMATILLGWRYGSICALLTVGLGFIFVNPYLPFFAATALAIAGTVELLRKRNMYRSFPTTIVSGLILAMVAAVVSAPVTALLFGGVTASGNDLVTAVFLKTGRSLLQSVFLSGLSSEPVDKTLVSMIAFIALNGLPEKFLRNFDLRSLAD